MKIADIYMCHEKVFKLMHSGKVQKGDDFAQEMNKMRLELE